MRASFDFQATPKRTSFMHHKSKHDMHRTKQKKWVKGRHGENITTANGLFEGFEKSVTNLERKISVKIFKQNYGVLICKYSAFEGKGEVSLLTLTREGSREECKAS
jgi:hypothetical protein